MSKPQGLSKPTVGERGAKIGAMGQPGTGKTELLMTARQVGHLLVVDSEGRTQYYDPDEYFGFEAIYSENIKRAIELLKYAEELHRKGDPVVFGVDGFSSMWFEQQEVAARIGSTSRGTAKYDSWGPAKKPLKQFYAALFATPLHVIVTMRAKPKYSMEGNAPKAAGYDAPDIERGLPYALDLIVEMNKDELPPGTPLVGKNFWALVTKTSGPKEDNPLPIGTKIEDPSFLKLMAVRLDGAAGGLQFEAGDSELQAAYVTIRTIGKLPAWMGKLGLDVEAAKATLREKYGDPKDSMLRTYIDEVWRMKVEGIDPTEEEDPEEEGEQ